MKAKIEMNIAPFYVPADVETEVAPNEQKQFIPLRALEAEDLQRLVDDWVSAIYKEANAVVVPPCCDVCGGLLKEAQDD